MEKLGNRIASESEVPKSNKAIPQKSESVEMDAKLLQTPTQPRKSVPVNHART